MGPSHACPGENKEGAREGKGGREGKTTHRHTDRHTDTHTHTHRHTHTHTQTHRHTHTQTQTNTHTLLYAHLLLAAMPVRQPCQALYACAAVSSQKTSGGLLSSPSAVHLTPLRTQVSCPSSQRPCCGQRKVCTVHVPIAWMCARQFPCPHPAFVLFCCLSMFTCHLSPTSTLFLSPTSSSIF